MQRTNNVCSEDCYAASYNAFLPDSSIFYLDRKDWHQDHSVTLSYLTKSSMVNKSQLEMVMVSVVEHLWQNEFTVDFITQKSKEKRSFNWIQLQEQFISLLNFLTTYPWSRILISYPKMCWSWPSSDPLAVDIEISKPIWIAACEKLPGLSTPLDQDLNIFTCQPRLYSTER